MMMMSFKRSCQPLLEAFVLIIRLTFPIMVKTSELCSGFGWDHTVGTNTFSDLSDMILIGAAICIDTDDNDLNICSLVDLKLVAKINP